MATVSEIRIKNIDLPLDVIQKLTSMAAEHGKTLKSYIESLLIAKTNSATSQNPSPSGDSWYDVPENLAMVNEGIEEYKAGKTKEYSIEEIRDILGV